MPRVLRDEQYHTEEVGVDFVIQQCIRRAWLMGKALLTGKDFRHSAHSGLAGDWKFRLRKLWPVPSPLMSSALQLTPTPGARFLAIDMTLGQLLGVVHWPVRVQGIATVINTVIAIARGVRGLMRRPQAEVVESAQRTSQLRSGL